MDKSKNKLSFISIFFISILCFFCIFTAPKGIKFFLYAEKVKGMTLSGECTDEIRDYFDKYIIFYDLPGEHIAARLDSNISYFLTGNIDSQQVVTGKNKWLFYKSSIDADPIEDYIGESRYTDEEMKAVLDEAGGIQQYWKKNGTKFLYIVPANKENIYYEYMPDDIKRISSTSRSDCIIEFLHENGINIINLKPILLSEKENPVYQNKELYYKYDTHWNQLGAYIGVDQIVKGFGEKTVELKSDGIDTRLLDDHLSADRGLAEMAGLRWFLKDEEDYSIQANPNIDYKYIEKEINQQGNAIIKNDKAVYNKTILVIGDSFRIAMIPSLSRYYSKVIVITGNDRYEDYASYHPDYVVYERVERYMGNAK